MNSLTGTSSLVAKTPESKIRQAYVKARNLNYQTTAEAIPHTIPMVTTQLATTVLSEILLTFGSHYKLRYPGEKSLLYWSEDRKVTTLVISCGGNLLEPSLLIRSFQVGLAIPENKKDSKVRHQHQSMARLSDGVLHFSNAYLTF